MRATAFMILLPLSCLMIAQTPGQSANVMASSSPDINSGAVERIAGRDRYQTAVEVAALVGGGSLTGLHRLIVVSGEAFPDGLAASGLAGFLDTGGRSGRTAILLTSTNELPATTAAAIRASAVPATHVLIVGGTASVSDSVRDAIATAAGWTGNGANPVTRIAGADRYSTAAAIVSYALDTVGGELNNSYKTVLIASGEQFPDALAAGTLAYRNGHFLLLSPAPELPEATVMALQQLRATDVLLIGGTAALSEELEAETRALNTDGTASELTASIARVTRIGGANRNVTATLVASIFVNLNGPPKAVSLASAVSYADALTTPPLAADNRPLLLTEPTQLPPSTNEWLIDHRNSIDEVIVIGGTNTVSPAIVEQANQATTPTPRPSLPPVPQPAPPTPVAVAPSAPSVSATTAGDQQITVVFSPGESGSAAITNYQYSTDAGVSWATRTPASITSPLIITGLTNGTTYAVALRAVSSVGPGEASPTSSATPMPPSCAEGGLCSVGDVGPGGGTVFYVEPDSGTFTSAAPCGAGCRYLEAAPTAGVNPWGAPPWWNPTAANRDFTLAWSGVTNVAVPGGTKVEIGEGYQNTLNMVAQSDTIDRAGTSSRAFRGPNNFDDWFLPSLDELNELCKWARSTGQAPGPDIKCSGGSGPRVGFSPGFYLSSSESTATRARGQTFTDPVQTTAEKWDTYNVRPIRAF